MYLSIYLLNFVTFSVLSLPFLYFSHPYDRANILALATFYALVVVWVYLGIAHNLDFLSVLSLNWVVLWAAIVLIVLMHKQEGEIGEPLNLCGYCLFLCFMIFFWWVSVWVCLILAFLSWFLCCFGGFVMLGGVVCG